MKQLLKTGGKLALICAVAATALALINMVTAPRIEYNREQRLLQALEEVSGGFEIGEEQEVEHRVITHAHRLFDEAGEPAGIILRMRSDGYGGEMQLIAGYRLDGSLITARLLDNEETPGLGKEAEEAQYMEKFEGKGSSDEPVPVRKDQLPEDQADAVTGSTITFSGIAEGLAAGAEYVRQQEGDES